MLNSDALLVLLADPRHVFSLLNMLKKKLSSQFFDLDIENPLGGGTLAKIELSL
jgi:hypothetical protein